MTVQEDFHIFNKSSLWDITYNIQTILNIIDHLIGNPWMYVDEKKSTDQCANIRLSNIIQVTERKIKGIYIWLDTQSTLYT